MLRELFPQGSCNHGNYEKNSSIAKQPLYPITFIGTFLQMVADAGLCITALVHRFGERDKCR